MNEKLFKIDNNLTNTLNDKLLLWDIGGGSTLGYISLLIIFLIMSMGVFEIFFLGDNYTSLKELISKTKKESNYTVDLSSERINDEDINGFKKYFYLVDYKLRTFIKLTLNDTFINILCILSFLFFFSGFIIGAYNQKVITSSVAEEIENIYDVVKVSTDYEIVSIVKNKELKDSYIISYLDNNVIKDIVYEGYLNINNNSSTNVISIYSYMDIKDIIKLYNSRSQYSFIADYSSLLKSKKDNASKVVINDTYLIK